MALLFLVFVAALTLLSAGGWVLVSRARRGKEERLKQSLHDLMSADEKPVVRPSGKRKPLSEPVARDLAVRLTASFDTLIATWGAFARSVRPYQELTAEAHALEYEALGRMELPKEPDEEAIAAFMEDWQCGYLRRQEIARAKEELLPALEMTAVPFIKAIDALVGIMGEIRELDRTFVVADETYDQSLRAHVVTNAANQDRQRADEIVSAAQSAREKAKLVPGAEKESEPDEGWDALLKAHLDHQFALVRAAATYLSAVVTAKETGKELQKNLDCTEPEKPDAALVNAYIDAIGNWCRQNMADCRKHDAAMNAVDAGRRAAHKACSDAYSCSCSSSAPLAVQASVAACQRLRALVDKYLNDWGEVEKRLTSRSSTQAKADVEPTGEEKNLIAALRSQTRALAMAIGASALAEKKRNDLNVALPAPDLVSVAVTDEASLARTMRLLDEWSRAAVRRETSFERAGVELSQRQEQFEECKQRLDETVSRARRYSRGKTCCDVFLELYAIADKMMAFQRAKEARRDSYGYGGFY